MGTCVQHFAWFDRGLGHWIGEWAGEVPVPLIPLDALGEDRLRQMNAWQQAVQAQITPDGSPFHLHDQVWDRVAWDACPSGGAVCLDVARFGWPVGDHRWHVWNDTARLLDWPESSTHRFIEVRMDTLEVVANWASNRPLRPSVPGQGVFDITGTPLAMYHGAIFGRFAHSGGRWQFVPRVVETPASVRRALAAAPLDEIITVLTQSPQYAPLARGR